MPLYMDIHIVESEEFSVEDVVKAHMEDLAIQDQFGVKQLKYWVNEQAKTIFCLMDGPNKEACHQVHLQSHGNTACNIVEVSDNEYNLFMGQGIEVNDLAKTESGELDTGYRSILLTNYVFFPAHTNGFTNSIHQLIEKFNGVIVREPSHQVMISFVYAKDAIACASSMKDLFEGDYNSPEFNLAIISGKPVDENGQTFFEETKSKAQGLCSLGFNAKMYLDRETIILSEKELISPLGELTDLNPLNEEEVDYLLNISNVINENLSNSNFNSEELIALLGFSKSQANRKIKHLTGFTPNQLIQEVRLQKALTKMSQKQQTIAEIAYDAGFNSPNYFTRVFKKRFGILPTDFKNRLEQ